MRINRFLARAGVSSRRGAEDIIKSGGVIVNGQKIENLATDIDPEKDLVKVAGQEIKLPSFKYYLLNKPTGYTTTRNDRFARHNVFELLPNDKSLITVGRLDRDTSGLLLITNDGDFAQNIIHPSNKIEKEYVVRTQRAVTDDQIEDILKGIELEDGIAKAKIAEKTSDKELVMVIEMGRKRVVRRILEAVGNKVSGLKRIRIGNIKLDVELGKYRELTKEEINDYL